MSTEPKPRVQVPDALREVLLEFSIAYLLEQPGDVVDYAVVYFTKLQESRRDGVSIVVSPDENGSQADSIQSQEEDKLTLLIVT